MPDAPLILCLDDQRVNVEIRAILLRQFGCEVIVTGDQEDALREVAEKPVDLVLLDFHLACGVDGDEVARAIRRMKPELPLVMLTGDGKICDEARATVNAVLIKGLSSPADLWETIQELVPGKKLRPRRGPFDMNQRHAG